MAEYLILIVEDESAYATATPDVIQARDLDHALDIAKLCPARFGGVEVRPIMVFG